MPYETPRVPESDKAWVRDRLAARGLREGPLVRVYMSPTPQIFGAARVQALTFMMPHGLTLTVLQALTLMMLHGLTLMVLQELTLKMLHALILMMLHVLTLKMLHALTVMM